LTTLAETFGPMPAMTTRAIGYGAGEREGVTRPNLLRVWIGEPADADGGDVDEVAVLETNVDDCSPEIIGHCLERLRREGAWEAYAVPIQTKKSRCGVLLTAICEPARAARLERILFAETTTFGVRRHWARRSKLLRRSEPVETPYGPIRMKVGTREGLETASPEYEDCKAAAERHGTALRTVIEAAQRAWRAPEPQ
jgi:hypothetical protein